MKGEPHPIVLVCLYQSLSWRQPCHFLSAVFNDVSKRKTWNDIFTSTSLDMNKLLKFIQYQYTCFCFHLLVFHRKDSVKQDLTHKVCSNFQLSFLYLCQMDPPIDEVSGQVVRSLGQAGCQVDVPPGRDILWPSLELLQVRLIFGQTYPPVEASSGQAWYYFRSD